MVGETPPSHFLNMGSKLAIGFWSLFLLLFDLSENL